MKLFERSEFFTLDKQWHDTGIKPEGYNEAKAAWKKANEKKIKANKIVK